MTEFVLFDVRATPAHLGEWPNIFDAKDERKASDQVNDRYDYGGGWRPMKAFTLLPQSKALCYPGDRPLLPFAACVLPLTAETVLFYPPCASRDYSGRWQL